MRARPRQRLGLLFAAAAVGLMLAPAAARATEVTLEQSLRQVKDSPWRLASVTVNNTGGATVGAIRLREFVGDAVAGPTFVWTCTVPPGSQQTLEIPLPAVSQQQRYQVTLLGDQPNAAAIWQGAADIQWDAAAVATEALINPDLVERLDPKKAAWPSELKRNVIVTLILFAIVAAGTLLLRRPMVRLAAAMVLAAGACAVIVVLLSGTETIGREIVPARSVEGQPWPVSVVSCRRSAQWNADLPLSPLYYNRQEMAQDDSIYVQGKLAKVPLKVGEVRLFRPAR